PRLFPVIVDRRTARPPAGSPVHCLGHDQRIGGSGRGALVVAGPAPDLSEALCSVKVAGGVVVLRNLEENANSTALGDAVGKGSDQACGSTTAPPVARDAHRQQLGL